MKQSDIEIIKSILNKEIESGSVEDLKKVKDMVIKAIDIKQQKRANIYDVLDLLKVDFKMFLYNELDTLNFRYFKPGAITAAIRKIKKYDKSRPILVYDVVGIGKNKLIEQQGVGEKTVILLEKLLNKYNLSLDMVLTFDERTIFYNSVEAGEKEMKAM